MSKYSSKDIEEMIERQKSLMDVELNDIRKKHSAIISDLEQQLKDAKEVEAKQAFIDSLVFKTDEWGRQYRVATQKMLDFADTIEHSCFSCWELNQEHTDIINEKKTIEQFAIEKNLPEDSFELIRDYISTFKPIMVRIQSINKSHYLEERKRYAELVYRNSPRYESDLREKRRLEDEREREKDALERGLVLAPWSINSDVQEWITPGKLQDYYANCGLSPNGNDYDDSGFATYP